MSRAELRYRAPRGTSDILPQEQGYWRYVEDKARAICQLHGYQRIETPVFEETGLFLRSIGEETDIVAKEMYTFPDRSGANMTLRPEGTAPVCRAYIEHGLHNLPQPVRLYYLAPIFRYERPQKGRYRQHQQFGFETLGDGDPAVDAEVIDIAWQFYHGLGLGSLLLKLNSIGCSACRPNYLQSLTRYYSEHIEQLCPDCRRRLHTNPLRLLDCKQESCLAVKEAAPRNTDHLCPECRAHFEQVSKYLGLLGLPFQMDHRLVRGLDYYTKTVFEVQPQAEEGAQSALGGGGRYDDLIEQLGGRPTPAVGFAAGIERIIINLKKQNVLIPSPPGPDLLIVYLGEQAKDKAIEYSSKLRREGIGAILAASDKSLKAQLRQANALGLSYALIIGEEELRERKVTVRDMVSGTQEAMGLEQALARLKNRQS